ncbi:MAG: lipopolysaccharide transport periplasmic protein LptA [Thioalkalivibrionaceae bacterium]
MLTATLSFVLLSGAAVAQEQPDRSGTNVGGLDLREAIDIEANEALFDDRSGVGEYRGDVIVRQGTLTLRGDRLRLFSEQRQPQRALLEGQPARMVDDNPLAPRDAEAREIDYSLVRDELILRGDARVKTPSEDARGDEIRYSMRDDTLEAKATEGRRVRVTIMPREGK